jgi:hypothetical protein
MVDQDKIILDALLRIMPFLAQSFEDIVVTLSDREKYIYYKAGKQLDHNIKPGDPVKEGSMTHRAYKHKGFLTANIGAEVFGMPYSALGFPVFDSNGEIIGGMVFCESIETKENKSLLKTLSEKMTENTALMCENIGAFINQSDNISSTVTDFISQTEEMAEKLHESSRAIDNLVDNLIKNDGSGIKISDILR